jgi:hypothetical protein
MIRLFIWAALGYVSCVWDCSCSPLHARWPSATAVFILLLAMRYPRCSVWGAGGCGLVMDAAQGGPLGPRVLAGVLIATLAGYFRIGHAETKWPRVALLVFIFSTGWLLAPVWAGIPDWGSAGITPAIVLQAVSTTLVTLAIRSLLRPVAHEDEAYW